MSRRVFITPDERTWLLWGRDLRAEGFTPAPSPATAEALVAPDRVPAPLIGPLAEAWAEVADPRELMTLAGPLEGVHVTEALLEQPSLGEADHHGNADHHGHAEDEHPAEDHGHAEHGGHGGHDHHAMMEVTGEPSSDGLVMENLEFRLGPLSHVLPAGVVAALQLDGDVVCAVELKPAFATSGADPTASAAWRAASSGDGDPRAQLIAIELERALSHATWAMSLGRLLGWEQLADRARSVARAVLEVGDDVDQRAVARATKGARRLLALVDDSRRLRFRLGGLATLTHDDIERLALAGPTARASGVPRDARLADESYRALGFQPALREAGDALARTLVRVEEIVGSLDLVSRALDAPAGTWKPLAVEGPRGPLQRPAADAAMRAASERLTGLEWSAFVAALASFELAGWVVEA